MKYATHYASQYAGFYVVDGKRMKLSTIISEAGLSRTTVLYRLRHGAQTMAELRRPPNPKLTDNARKASQSRGGSAAEREEIAAYLARRR